MSSNPFTPAFQDLPGEMAIFPLDGVVLLPKGDLPLNIFEPQYLSMIDDALKGSRMIGIIQPFGGQLGKNGDAIFRTGCAGRITQFSETDDGRYSVTLRGVCRFNVLKELPHTASGYRMVKPSWNPFEHDMDTNHCVEIDRKNLCGLLRKYFELQGITLEWPLLHDIENDEILMTMLAMICPFTSSEKQALLEAPCCNTRANLFMSLLEMSVQQACSGCSH